MWSGAISPQWKMWLYKTTNAPILRKELQVSLETLTHWWWWQAVPSTLYVHCEGASGNWWWSQLPVAGCWCSHAAVTTIAALSPPEMEWRSTVEIIIANMVVWMLQTFNNMVSRQKKVTSAFRRIKVRLKIFVQYSLWEDTLTTTTTKATTISHWSKYRIN